MLQLEKFLIKSIHVNKAKNVFRILMECFWNMTRHITYQEMLLIFTF